MNTLPSTRSPIARFPAMARWSPLLVVVAVLAACGGDPPVPCPGFSIPDIRVHVRETDLIQACFDDPEDEVLTIKARVSDPEIASALPLQSAIRVKGLSPGEATVTVTAEDPGGQTASIDFKVIVPNRPPIARGEFDPVRMLVDGSRSYEVDLFFFDPDEQPLSFEMENTNPVAVEAKIFDSIKMSIKGIAEGTSVVTVVAKDPMGETATRSVDVSVFEPVQIFRADFDDGDYGGFFGYPSWLTNTRVEDGKYVMSGRYNASWGWSRKLLGTTVEEWEVTSSLGKAAKNNKKTAPGFLSYIGGTDPVYYGMTYGYDDVGATYWGLDDDYNFAVMSLAFTSEWWHIDPGHWGYSDACDNDPGELMDATLAVRNGELTGKCGETLVVRINMTEQGWAGVSNIDNLYLAVLGVTANNEVWYDWVEMNALPPEEEAQAQVDWDEGPTQPEDVFTFKRGIDIPR
ncbi:MAG: hypothetical protein OXU64_03350 [Gemmatimonadota bacterium]|nr:hypothetical protein [Gemmatimonadota bacterium]